MPSPLRLVRLITWLPIGGIERRLVATLPRIDREIFAPEVICLRERGPLAEDLERAGIPVHVLPLRSRLSPIGLWRLSRRLRGADIVHSHMYRSNVPGTVAARLARVPVVVGHIHNVDTWERHNQRRWDRLTARRRAATIAVSHGVQRNFCETLGLDAALVPVIHNGIDLTPFETPMDRTAARGELGLGEGTVALICAARLHRQKNHRGLLEAVASLPSDLPPWFLLLAGDGGERESLEQMVVQRGLGSRVRFLRSRDDVPRILRACDVAVLASEKEGFSNVVLESLAAGLPVVATDVGGNAEAIEEGESGSLVPRGDMRALADRLARLIADAELRRRMGERARQRARAFSLEEMIRKTECLYLETLRRRRPGRFDARLSEALERRRAPTLTS
ncbi:glycosyltransferase [Candidatus Sumerlaeota bacterium]|nr:glycosyltransferase [Candidatus Sumerlaeota bacterium]